MVSVFMSDDAFANEYSSNDLRASCSSGQAYSALATRISQTKSAYAFPGFGGAISVFIRVISYGESRKTTLCLFTSPALSDAMC